MLEVIDMNAEKLLQKYHFPQEATNTLLKSGITQFFPPQEAAIHKGILEGKSLVLAVPTAAGKTLIAELCMVRSILQKGGRCLYVAPLKALASEKYDEFKEKYTSLGINV